MNLSDELLKLQKEQKILIELKKKLESQLDGLQVEELTIQHKLKMNLLSFEYQTLEVPVPTQDTLNDQQKLQQSQTLSLNELNQAQLNLNPNYGLQQQIVEIEEEDYEENDVDKNEHDNKSNSTATKQFTVL